MFIYKLIKNHIMCTSIQQMKPVLIRLSSRHLSEDTEISTTNVKYISDEMFNSVLNTEIKKYSITFGDTKNNLICIKSLNGKILNNDDLDELKYKYKKDCIKMSMILSSLVFKYNNICLSFFKKDKMQIENCILYVFLMPYLSSDGEFVIKPGYTKDLDERKVELLKEHNIDNIYLIYAKEIKCQPLEQELHKRLKKEFQELYYPVYKYNKKNEISTECTETYIFTFKLLHTIIADIYKMSLTYEGEILEKKLLITREEKEIEQINADKEIKIAEAKAKEAEAKAKEAEAKAREKEAENENLKLQIKLQKLEILKNKNK